MEESIIQSFTETLHKELAPMKLNILEIKQEIRLVNQRIENVELRMHRSDIKNEHNHRNMTVLAENIQTAAENRKMILGLNSRVQRLETL
jgi:predicted  nucleic acid-binding Zn-ribbon protein